MTYAVQTEACTYLLDDEGVCKWIISPGGLVTPGMSSAVGAQFVACLDLEVPGGLVAELRVGAAALFARHDDRGKFVLLRTSAIRHVEAKELNQPLPAAPPIRAAPIITASPPKARPPKLPKPPRPPGSKPSKPPPRPSRPPPPSGDPPVMVKPPSPVALRGELTGGSFATEETLTTAKPLFRPRPPAPSASPRPPTPAAPRAPAPPVPKPPLPERPRSPPVPAPRSIILPPSGPPDIPATPPRARRPSDPSKKGKR